MVMNFKYQDVRRAVRRKFLEWAWFDPWITEKFGPQMKSTFQIYTRYKTELIPNYHQQTYFVMYEIHLHFFQSGNPRNRKYPSPSTPKIIPMFSNMSVDLDFMVRITHWYIDGPLISGWPPAEKQTVIWAGVLRCTIPEFLKERRYWVLFSAIRKRVYGTRTYSSPQRCLKRDLL